MTPLSEARAWRIATQIVRRFPDELTLTQTVFDPAPYFLMTVIHAGTTPDSTGERGYFHVNRGGTAVAGRHYSSLPPELDKQARDPVLLFAPAARFYQRLLAHFSMPDPRPLPPATPEVMSFRFVVE